MPAISAVAVPTVGHSRVKPSVYLSPTAQPISSTPATKDDPRHHSRVSARQNGVNARDEAVELRHTAAARLIPSGNPVVRRRA